MGNSESYKLNTYYSSKSQLTQSDITVPTYLQRYKREQDNLKYYKRSTSFIDDHPKGMSRKLSSWRAGSQRRQKMAQWNIIEKEKRMAEQRDQLFSAIISGDYERVEQMVARGADVNSFDENHLTPLHYAAMYSRPQMISLLIENGADPNAYDMKGGFTPMHWVVINSNPDMVYAQKSRCDCLEALVRGGCHINSKDFNQATPLHFAARKDDKMVVDALMKLGANPNDVDVLGRTCASVAKSEQTKILIIKLADLRARAIYHVLEIPPSV